MSENEILSENVEHLKKMFSLPPLSLPEMKNLEQLLRLGKIMEFEDGDIIIREGNTDAMIYFMLSGKVRVEKAGFEISIIEGPGEIFGELRILDGLARSATVIALEKTVCLAVDTAVAVTRMSKDERASMMILLYRVFTEFIAIRLRLLNDELVAAKMEIERLKAC